MTADDVGVQRIRRELRELAAAGVRMPTEADLAEAEEEEAGAAALGPKMASVRLSAATLARVRDLVPRIEAAPRLAALAAPGAAVSGYRVLKLAISVGLAELERLSAGAEGVPLPELEIASLAPPQASTADGRMVEAALAAGWTVARLAEALGVSVSTIYGARKGARRLSAGVSLELGRLVRSGGNPRRVGE
jgi:hypothetical protein